ncbi:DNA cytosine methyltransferase [Pseudoxanthomonas sp. LjRoot143]|uniref:DNA cytosine methyltransferase n=1 Tax=Pseudoxanthomonas sp. LjRoot143 TaxID=3342266 RepID=UPI003ECD36FD
MADGGARTQLGFHLPDITAVSRLRAGEIVVDLFAGGGGASKALEGALARAVDVAINHNPYAIGMHAANHPYTKHLCEDVWQADPVKEAAGRPVGWLHASPDCTHFSQAKGGQPRDRATRSLAWVIPKWAGSLKRAGKPPRIISMENVMQMLKWGPLVAKRDKATCRVVKLDGTVAAKGERVPLQQQFLIPDKRREGQTWRQFIGVMRALGYVAEWRKLKACDYGAGTSRERLFAVFRCDGEPIRWPEPTHGPGRAHPYVTAADCIDWSIPCPSIFTRARPLADATMKRIARGVKRYVLDAAEPFIVGVGGRMGQTMERATGEPMQTITAKADACVCTPTLVECANASADGVTRADAPLRTITAWPKGGSHAVASAALVKFRHDSEGAPIDAPLPTITSGAGAARPAGAAHAMGVMTAHLEQANGGFYDGDGKAADEPLSTITSSGTQQRLVATSMVTMRGENVGAAADDPLRTISAGGEHHALLSCELSPEHEAGALRVAAFLINYYGNGQALALPEPIDTITTRDRLALVTVTVQGVPHVIVDIGLRMLQRHELFRAQGFPADYIIDRMACGTPLSGSRSVAMVGNSVSPPPLHAIAVANLDPADADRMAA